MHKTSITNKRCVTYTDKTSIVPSMIFTNALKILLWLLSSHHLRSIQCLFQRLELCSLKHLVLRHEDSWFFIPCFVFRADFTHFEHCWHDISWQLVLLHNERLGDIFTVLPLKLRRLLSRKQIEFWGYNMWIIYIFVICCLMRWCLNVVYEFGRSFVVEKCCCLLPKVVLLEMNLEVLHSLGFMVNEFRA